MFILDQAADTETVDDQSTSMFRVDRIAMADDGRWVCQVKTTSVQVEKDFIVSVKGETSHIQSLTETVSEELTDLNSWRSSEPHCAQFNTRQNV